MQRTEVILIDDLTGETIAKGEGESISFTFDGKSYSLDLTKDNAKSFREAIKPYLDAAQPASGGTTTRATRSTGSKHDKGYLQSVRNWAALKGIEVSPRGRIKSEVIAAYEADNAA